MSCCAYGGSWYGKCGSKLKGFQHTWIDGVDACKSGSGGTFLQVGIFAKSESLSLKSQPNITRDFEVVPHQENVSFGYVYTTSSAYWTNTLSNFALMSNIVFIIFSCVP